MGVSHQSGTNELCNNASWNILDGDWKFSATDCSVQAWDWPVSRNLMWFGSADGLTPNNLYIDDRFNLTVTLSIPTQQGGAGIVFRMNSRKEEDYYFLHITGHGNFARLGRWSTAYWEPIENVSVSSIDSNTTYTLAVHATGSSYDIYFDGELIMDGIQLSELRGGSIGLQTSFSQATFYSLEYTADSTFNSTTSIPLSKIPPNSPLVEQNALPPICFYLFMKCEFATERRKAPQ